ncbi:DUF1413 domain-containing protein [Cetobacterium sp. SF1]|uniref:DUF1413 domain-containing protein n=1 Tax=unclassified Cetobacterium TaxID=2630983 RepID=UPI003CEA16D5
MRSHLEQELYEKELEKLLEEAMEEINLVEKGAVFLLKDLFKGHYWKNIENSLKSKLSTRFYLAVKRIESIEVIDNTGMGYQKYKKV